MASITSTQPSYLDVPDEEVQRGRKRRRSSGAHTTSVGSTTLRGRGRRRSLSTNVQSSDTAEERHRSSSLGRKSPGKKYAKKYFNLSRLEKRRRSQSLSRSQSTGHRDEKKSPKPRRRQRTRSRSRVHGDKEVEKGTNEPTSARLDSPEVAIED